jgi:hypothetical protein
VDRREGESISVVRDGARLMTPLNELVRRLALLAAPRTYTLTARLLDGRDGNRIEMRAEKGSGAELREYTRHVNLMTLERHGAPAVAKAFAREAAEALAENAASTPRNREAANKN